MRERNVGHLDVPIVNSTQVIATNTDALLLLQYYMVLFEDNRLAN